MSDPKNKKAEKKEFEMPLMTVLFGLLTAAILLSIFVPSLADFGTICYALIAIVGVITCARDRAFMAIDSLVNVFPEPLKKIMNKLSDILMVLVFVILFALGIIGTQNWFKAPTYTDNLGIPMVILYIAPIIVYPIATILFIKSGKNKKEEN